jgi:hypothetical protein
MCNAVDALASAFWVTRREKYAERALLLLRTWFIDESTRMNPHLKYAEGVPGIWEGTSWGIIDTFQIPSLFDSIAMLHSSKAWTKADTDGLNRWARDYLQWLLTDRNGKAERARYYALTPAGRKRLREETAVWRRYSRAVEAVLQGA